jgi:hypothetical protein
MTTIACNRDEMAADSRTSDSCTYFTTTDKIVRLGDALVGCCGNLDSIAKFLDWYQKRGDIPDFDDDDFEAIVLKKDGMFLYANSCRERRIKDKYFATGSGGMAALAAMHCGKTPAEAVRVAIRCDKNSGLPVVNFQLGAD